MLLKWKLSQRQRGGRDKGVRILLMLDLGLPFLGGCGGIEALPLLVLCTVLVSDGVDHRIFALSLDDRRHCQLTK